MVTDNQFPSEIQNAIIGERSRIARDLHDGVAQQLALALLQLEYLQRLLENEGNHQSDHGHQPALTTINKVSSIIQASLLELRHCISSAIPLSLTQHHFAQALQTLLEAYRSEGWHVCYYCDEQASVPKRWEVPVYRFLQEALTNIRKHAQASHITIRFLASADTLTIAVSDDGCGFQFIPDDALPFEHTQHFGLRMMRDHIERLGGQWQLWSQPGQGTKLQIAVPLSL